MQQPVIDVVDLFPGLRSALIALLGELSPDDWQRPTACDGWSVHDVALHVLGVDVNIIAHDRDGQRQAVPPGLDLSDWNGLVAFIDQRNAIWVEATRRLSPRMTRDFLAETGPQVEAWFQAADLLAPGDPVDWAGPDPAPVWVHVAREYTERWVHQQHIRDAVGRPGMTEQAWLHPVLDAFALALPHTLRDVIAPPGAVVTLIVTGPAGGRWSVVSGSGKHRLATDRRTLRSARRLAGPRSGHRLAPVHPGNHARAGPGDQRRYRRPGDHRYLAGDGLDHRLTGSESAGDQYSSRLWTS